MTNYNNFSEIINLLDLHKINYVIMRNYSNLLSDDIYISGHADIDILCEDSVKFAKVVNAIQQSKGDITHYYIYIKGKKVSLDLRHVGDGYYPTNWQIDILHNKELHPDGFYVMDDLNYLYSLTYHAIVQKRVVSTDYLNLLVELSKKNGININFSNIIQKLVSNLEKFMLDKGYKYTYVKDKTVTLNKKYINKKLIENDLRLQFTHWKFDTRVWIIEKLVEIKHFLKI